MSLLMNFMLYLKMSIQHPFLTVHGVSSEKEMGIQRELPKT